MVTISQLVSSCQIINSLAAVEELLFLRRGSVVDLAIFLKNKCRGELLDIYIFFFKLTI